MAEAATGGTGGISKLFNGIVKVGLVVAAAIIMEPLILYLFHTMTGGMILQNSLTPILESFTNAFGINELFTNIGNWISQYTVPELSQAANMTTAPLAGGSGAAYAFD